MTDRTRVPTCNRQGCEADGVVQSTAFRLCAMHAAADLRRLREGAGPECRYCGADCTYFRSWDGGDLFACPPCANARAQAHRRGERWPPKTASEVENEQLRALLRHAVDSGDVTAPAQHGCVKCRRILALVDEHERVPATEPNDG